MVLTLWNVSRRLHLCKVARVDPEERHRIRLVRTWYDLEVLDQRAQDTSHHGLVEAVRDVDTDGVERFAWLWCTRYLRSGATVCLLQCSVGVSEGMDDSLPSLVDDLCRDHISSDTDQKAGKRNIPFEW